MEIKEVIRNVNDLKPDPEQPRKEFKEEDIKLLAETYKSQGIINPIEIDENNMIITGELRWKASKKANLKKIKCKLITGLSKEDKFERQTIENLHHNILTPKERENAIRKLWESGNYTSKSELAKRIGMDTFWIEHIIDLKEQRKKLGITLALENKISSRTLLAIKSLSVNDQRQMIRKILNENIKEGTQLREYVQTIKKLPEDLKEVVLEINSQITPETALEIAQFPEKEQRKQMIGIIKDTQDFVEETMRTKLEIIKGKKESPIIDIINPIKDKMEYLQRLRLRILNHYNIRYIGGLPIEVRSVCIRDIRNIIEHLREVLTEFGETNLPDKQVIKIRRNE